MNINRIEIKIACNEMSAAQVFTQMKQHIDSKQAKIDALMFEFCPDEMTDKQLSEWEKHQKISNVSHLPNH